MEDKRCAIVVEPYLNHDDIMESSVPVEFVAIKHEFEARPEIAEDPIGFGHMDGVLKTEENDLQYTILQLQCDICQQPWPTAKELITHRYTHTEDTRFACLICSATYSLKERLYDHMTDSHLQPDLKSSSDKDKICCNNCSSAAYLKMQDNIHSDKEFQCDMCHKQFTLNASLIGHDLLQRRFECDICQKLFKEKSYLTEHKRIHTGEKRYECDTCHESFTRETSLIEHERTHNGEKPFECDICQKRFARNIRLTNHKSIHTGEKQHECNVCMKRFRDYDYLIKHKRIHTGDKRYECEVCLKRFRVNGDLVRHNRTHTGEKPYECTYCHKRFAERSTLTNHERVHTGEKPYQCENCHKQFAVYSSFSKHKCNQSDD